MSIFTTLNDILNYLEIDPNSINKDDPYTILNAVKSLPLYKYKNLNQNDITELTTKQTTPTPTTTPLSKIKLENKEYYITTSLLKILISAVQKPDQKIVGFTVSNKGTIYYYDSQNKIRTTIDNLLYKDDKEPNMCKYLGLTDECKPAILSCILSNNKDCLNNITGVINNNFHDIILNIEAHTEEYQKQYRILFYSLLFQLGWYGNVDDNKIYQLVSVDKWIYKYDLYNLDDKLINYLNELVEFINKDKNFTKDALSQTKRLVTDLDTKEYNTDQLLHILNKRFNTRKIETTGFSNLNFNLSWILPGLPFMNNITAPGMTKMYGGGNNTLYNYYHQKYENLKTFLNDIGKNFSDKSISKYESTLNELHNTESKLMEMNNLLNNGATANQIGGSVFNYVENITDQIKKIHKINKETMIMLDKLDMLPVKLVISDKKYDNIINNDNNIQEIKTISNNTKEFLDLFKGLYNALQNKMMKKVELNMEKKIDKEKIRQIEKDIDSYNEKILNIINKNDATINKVILQQFGGSLDKDDIKAKLMEISDIYKNIQKIIKENITIFPNTKIEQPLNIVNITNIDEIENSLDDIISNINQIVSKISLHVKGNSTGVQTRPVALVPTGIPAAVGPPARMPVAVPVATAVS